MEGNPLMNQIRINQQIRGMYTNAEEVSKDVVQKSKDAESDDKEKDKDLEKGESVGSRGGKVIGQTSTGKPVYDHSQHTDHTNFSAAEHHEAANFHAKAHNELRAKYKKGDYSKENMDVKKQADDHKLHYNEHKGYADHATKQEAEASKDKDKK